MSGTYYADDLGSAVHYALETTHAIAVCPFHLDQTIRIGDDAAERHAFARARKLVRRDGTTWQGDALRKEFGCQLGKPPTGTVLAASLRTIRGKATGFSAPILPVLLPAMDMSTLCRGLTTNHNLPARAAVISLRLRRRSCGNSQPQS